MKKKLTLSVHQLVDFLLRTGDIDNRIFNKETMTTGSRMHQTYQANQKAGYMAEYPLSKVFILDEFEITLQGKADGITKKSGLYYVEEIKTTVDSLEKFKSENFNWHIGQAKCYALMLCYEKQLTEVFIRMTYISQGDEKKKEVDDYFFNFDELDSFVKGLLDEYTSFYSIINAHLIAKKASISSLDFPFTKYRTGQKEMTKFIYSTEINSGGIFCQAPTGIGKTMASLYGSLKFVEQEEDSKIFYLTAKGTGKESALSALEKLENQGLDAKYISITAKEKVCFGEKGKCNPDDCPYAQGYYTKILHVLKDSFINYNRFDLEKILDIAKENQMCPFELSLDLSLFCDVVICDYNYLFDPISFMKRYFSEGKVNHIALIDEAHNLVERSRNMYSSLISRNKFEKMKRSLRHIKFAPLKKHCTKISKGFIDLDALIIGEYLPVERFDDNFVKSIESFVNCYPNYIKNHSEFITDETRDFYFECSRFIKLYELDSERYLNFYSRENSDLLINHYCLDTSRFIQNTLNDLRSYAMFSATFSPIEYYKQMFGADYSTPTLILKSPFPKENLKVLIAPKVSIKYKERNESIKEVCSYIKSFISSKVGNYFIFCPSYEYKKNLENKLDLGEINIISQEKEFNDFEKIEFLEKFKPKPETTTVGLLVIGGTFGEGIDLIDDRLIGCVIIGIGLPKMNFQSDSLVEYYNENGLPGYDYAYAFPGINKVMQAAGRVIRSEYDKGSILLIDERYGYRKYLSVISEQWPQYQMVLSADDVKECLIDFYKKNN